MVAKVGMKKGIHKKNCSKCEQEKEFASKRYCNKCHAAYMREWRKNNPLSESQRIKNNIRRETLRQIKLGFLKKYPCEECGEVKSEAHHDDYSKPLLIRWLCRKHHLHHHQMEWQNTI